MSFIDRLFGWKDLSKRKPPADTPIPVAAKPVIETSTMNIEIVPIKEDAPKFKRQYSALLTTKHSGTVRIKVKLYNGYCNSRYDSSEITQKNGSWILFDVHKPADKIIDRELLPLVQEFCSKVLTLDREYCLNFPTSFTDEKGVVWERVGTI